MDSAEIVVEKVSNCPICGSGSRRIFYQDLRDELFSAPGVWSLHRCLDCRAAYLDPRPAPQSIGLMYRDYYTHAPSPSVPTDSPRTGRLGRVKDRLRNGYLAGKFGLPLAPSWKVAGRLVPLLFPRYRIAFDTSVRHLPLPRVGAHVLDVGCGSGEFLRHARTAGWEVTGIEIDSVAASIAAERGIRVIQKSMSDAGFSDSSFEAVTMNHVIEHLHDPRAALREAFRILKPFGLLWIATPNIDSPLRKRLGPSWRGLEVPRHLVLFSRTALRSAIQGAGFTRLSWPRTYPLTRWMFDASPNGRASQSGRETLPTEFQLRLLELGSVLTQNLSEQLVALAMKPGESRS